MERGDLIEISRLGFQHWAVYVGDGDVVHLARLSKSASSSWFSAITAVVKKEKLSDVVGNDCYHVNNKYDSKYPVRDPEYIVYLANRQVGRRIKYTLSTNNCEHFAYYLRYYVPISDQVTFGWEPAGFKVYMERGDLIEISRLGYQHWAVYVGHGDVVHLATESEFTNDGGGNSSWFMGITAVVKKEKLSEVVGNDCYCVNNKHDSTHHVRDPKDIVSLANRLVGRITDKLYTNNSEHFAYYLHYDVSLSDQAKFVWQRTSNTILEFDSLLVAVGGLLLFLKIYQGEPRLWGQYALLKSAIANMLQPP